MQVSERLVVELVVVDADIVGREVGRGFGESVELLGEVDTWEERGRGRQSFELESRRNERS